MSLVGRWIGQFTKQLGAGKTARRMWELTSLRYTFHSIRLAYPIPA